MDIVLTVIGMKFLVVGQRTNRWERASRVLFVALGVLYVQYLYGAGGGVVPLMPGHQVLLSPPSSGLAS